MVVMWIPMRFSSNFVSSFKFCSRAESALPKVGDTLKLAKVFTDEDVVGYSKASHDINPIHFDAVCARNAGFRDRLVHGMLVASMFPSIISTHFPGAVYVSQTLQFRQPVYIGEEVSCEVQAINVRDLKKNHLVKFSTKCFNQGKILVLDGEATTILPAENLM